MEPTTAKVTAAVEVIRKRIQQVRERKELIGEQNTKAALIDPLLSAMGWELQEIDEVRREYRRKPQDNPVDYALFAPLIRAICKKANGVTRSEARASLKRAKITIDFPLPKVLEQPAAPAVPSVN